MAWTEQSATQDQKNDVRYRLSYITYTVYSFNCFGAGGFNSSERDGRLPHHDEVHAALVAESADKLSVLRVVAVLGQAAEAGGSAVEHLGAPAEVYNNFNIKHKNHRIS